MRKGESAFTDGVIAIAVTLLVLDIRAGGPGWPGRRDGNAGWPGPPG